MLMEPPWLSSSPLLVALPSGTVTSTAMWPEGSSVRNTLLPAASPMVPSGASIVPAFSTSGAIRKTWPPGPATMVPRFLMLPEPPSRA